MRVGFLAGTLLAPVVLTSVLLGGSRAGLGALVVGAVAVANFWLLLWLVRASSGASAVSVIGALVMKLVLLATTLTVAARAYADAGFAALLGGGVVVFAVLIAASLGWLAEDEGAPDADPSHPGDDDVARGL